MARRKMDPHRWALIESLYHEALQLEPDERPAWLLQARGEAADVCEEVASLLARADGHLSNPDARQDIEKLWDQFAGQSRSNGLGHRCLGLAHSVLPSTIGGYRI